MSGPRLTPAAALAALAAGARERHGLARHYLQVFARGSLALEVYRPEGEDLQTPHARDELYVVIAGRGEFVCAGERHPFEPGEVLFVPAGVEHRFENFSNDFSTWVVFYGPEGGETP